MFRLMLVTERGDTSGRDLVEVVRAAVDGGVDCVQVREKDLDDGALSELTARIAGVAGTAALLVNGRPAVASSLGLGLHLAESDPLPAFRVSSAVGRSVHSVEGATRAKGDGLDYLLLGTIYETISKPGLHGSGVSLVSQVAAAVGGLPVLAIGGIDASNVGEVVCAGAYGVAVRSAILRAKDPAHAAEAIRSRVERSLLQ